MTEAEIARWLTRWLSARTGLAETALAPETSLASLGLGSRDAVELAGELSDQLGFEVPATAAWDHPSLGALAAHLAGGAPRQRIERQAPAPGPASREPVAVVGLACRLPGALSAEALWELLVRGGDAITAVPPDPWRDALRTAARHGGFLPDLPRFDAAFFGVSAREAAAMDPQQRLLLELTWEALEDAGIPPRGLAGQPVGTFVGIAASDYGRLLLADSDRADQYAGTGNALSIAANRIAYALDLVGPSLAVDTACSSSLVAVHLACESLAAGTSTLALAGGANVLLDPAVTASFTRAGFMAPDGRCRAFAARASGYVRSEGAGVVVLAPLSVARARGWPVRALILGSAVNQDGRSNGLTAPSARSQERVVAAAHARAGIAGGDIQYVEAHGTGTPLGDPIEARALGRVLARGRAPSERCRIGSIKSNVGHLEAAAGIAGLIKVVLSLEHGQIPPSVHFDAPNPHIPFADLALEVPVALAPWPAHRGPARAGVSAFGFGGTNAHVVLEAAPVPAAPASSAGGAVLRFEISAATPAALDARARQLADWLEGEGRGVDLADIAHTLFERRSPLAHRAAVSGTTHGEVAAALRASTPADPGAVVPPGRPVRLPAYPWQREHHWTDLTPPESRRDHPWLSRGVASSRHPGEWTFEVELSPRRHAWLWDHRVGERAVLPLAAHVELALAAARAAGRPAALTALAVDRALQLPDEIVRLQTVVEPGGAFHTAHATETGFVPLAHGHLADASAEVPEPLETVRARCTHPLDAAELYAGLAARGLAYGPAFKRLAWGWRGEGEALAELVPAADDPRFALAPAALDAAFHALAAAAPPGAELVVPVGAARVERHGSAAPAIAHAELRGLTGRIALYAADATPVALVTGLALRALAERSGPRAFRVAWRAAPGPAAGATRPGDGADAGAGRWLILSDRGGRALALAAAVERAGGQARVVASGGALLGVVAEVVVDLRALDDGTALDGARAEARSVEVLETLQSVSVGRVIVVARGGLATTLGGLVATFLAERPAIEACVVDLDGDVTALLDAPRGEERLAFDGVWRAARLEPSPTVQSAFAPALDPEALYLVTGGFGALGMHAAWALAAGGARHLVLVGRRPPANPAAVLPEGLRSSGAAIYGKSVDVADAGAVRELIGGLRAFGRPLLGIVHCAGALADATLERQTAGTFATAFAAKVQGAWNLHEATRGHALDHFILYASIAGVVGSPGQASYAAANAALDALALSRRQEGLAALSIAWGPWAGEGLAAGAAGRLAAGGLVPLDPADGRAALAAASGNREACITIADADLARLAARLPRPLALLADVVPAGADAPRLAVALAAAPAEERTALLLEHLRRRAAVVLGAPGEELETDVPLIDLGLDSLVTLELQQWLERELGTAVPGSHFLGNPTLARLAETLIAGQGAAREPADLAAEVRLDARIAGGPAAAAESPARVLLTGGTGYLGAYLLSALLERSDARVDCLVRAGDAGAGLARLKQNLARYRPWDARWDGRVRAVPGDLGAPALGLAARDWDELAGSCSVVIHAGAWVNFAYAYSVLQAANCGGTAELLRLATHGGTRPVHHVSTVGMLLSTAHPAGAVLTEDAAELPWRGLANGYEQSKWVADRMAALARARGVPASIHRVGLLAGESDSGRYLKRDDFFPAWLKGCIQLGAMPALATLTALVPVDHAARLLAALALAGEPPRTYHLTHPHPVPLSELAQVIVDQGHPLELLPFGAWKERLTRVLARGEDNELATHRHFVELLEEQQSVFPRLDATHAAVAAARYGLRCPPVPELVARYLAHWRATGWLTSARG